jgi:hypothetical protein
MMSSGVLIATLRTTESTRNLYPEYSATLLLRLNFVTNTPATRAQTLKPSTGF